MQTTMMGIEVQGQESRKDYFKCKNNMRGKEYFVRFDPWSLQ